MPVPPPEGSLQPHYRYLPHQAHQDFVKVLRPVLDKVLVLDYVSKD